MRSFGPAQLDAHRVVFRPFLDADTPSTSRLLAPGFSQSLLISSMGKR